MDGSGGLAQQIQTETSDEMKAINQARRFEDPVSIEDTYSLTYDPSTRDDITLASLPDINEVFTAWGQDVVSQIYGPEAVQSASVSGSFTADVDNELNQIHLEIQRGLIELAGGPSVEQPLSIANNDLSTEPQATVQANLQPSQDISITSSADLLGEVEYQMVDAATVGANFQQLVSLSTEQGISGLSDQLQTEYSLSPEAAEQAARDEKRNQIQALYDDVPEVIYQAATDQVINLQREDRLKFRLAEAERMQNLRRGRVASYQTAA